MIAELGSAEQVKKVYKKFVREDRGERKHRLGDKKCDLAIVLKPNKYK